MRTHENFGIPKAERVHTILNHFGIYRNLLWFTWNLEDIWELLETHRESLGTTKCFLAIGNFYKAYGNTSETLVNLFKPFQAIGNLKIL